MKGVENILFKQTEWRRSFEHEDDKCRKCAYLFEIILIYHFLLEYFCTEQKAFEIAKLGNHLGISQKKVIKQNDWEIINFQLLP